MARSTVVGVRSLTGRPADYTKPVEAVTRGILQLVNEFAIAGGDLGAMNITVEASPEGDVRGTVIRVEGRRA